MGGREQRLGGWVGGWPRLRAASEGFPVQIAMVGMGSPVSPRRLSGARRPALTPLHTRTQVLPGTKFALTTICEELCFLTLLNHARRWNLNLLQDQYVDSVIYMVIGEEEKCEKRSKPKGIPCANGSDRKARSSCRPKNRRVRKACSSCRSANRRYKALQEVGVGASVFATCACWWYRR